MRTSGGRGVGNCWPRKSGRLCGPGRASGKCGRPPNACSTSPLDRYGVAESTGPGRASGKCGRPPNACSTSPLDRYGVAESTAQETRPQLLIAERFVEGEASEEERQCAWFDALSLSDYISNMEQYRTSSILHERNQPFSVEAAEA